MSKGAVALLMGVAASAVGVAYFAYLNAVPFPPDAVRLVPLAWLAACVAVYVRARQAWRMSDGRLAAGVALALNIPSSLFAALFSLAALMGD